ncbi:MAG: CRISPR system precrRNA processing endoribonuclease RAMP protein Cas6 [bacterium]|nr:CRISPR system precrRNA processing endoribonuclease RAMP protein Cas6 [bacterium]
MTTAHNHLHFTQGFTLQHLRFVVRPIESIVFVDHAGSAVRGALYQAMSENFCTEPFAIQQSPNHAQSCPTCWLLNAENPTSQRGNQTARPITVEPPQPRTYSRHDPFSFGFTFMGKAQNFIPYVARAVQKMGQIGIGKGRGRFELVTITEYNPLYDAHRDLMKKWVVQAPTLQITPARIDEQVTELSADKVVIQLITPLRLTQKEHLVKFPDPVAFISRLLERMQSLTENYAEASTTPPVPDDWRVLSEALKAHAQKIRVAYDETQWLDTWSGSSRQGGYTPTGGIVGRFRWEGDLTPILPWLLWGQSLHVGKDAVKGNGWYRIIREL